MLEPLLASNSSEPHRPVPELDAKTASDALQILQITGPAVHDSLVPEILLALPAVVQCCGHASNEVGRVAVSCAVELADAHHAAVLPLLLR